MPGPTATVPPAGASSIRAWSGCFASPDSDWAYASPPHQPAPPPPLQWRQRRLRPQRRARPATGGVRRVMPTGARENWAYIKFAGAGSCTAPSAAQFFGPDAPRRKNIAALGLLGADIPAYGGCAASHRWHAGVRDHGGLSAKGQLDGRLEYAYGRSSDGGCGGAIVCILHDGGALGGMQPRRRGAAPAGDRRASGSARAAARAGPGRAGPPRRGVWPPATSARRQHAPERREGVALRRRSRIDAGRRRRGQLPTRPHGRRRSRAAPAPRAPF